MKISFSLCDHFKIKWKLLPTIEIYLKSYSILEDIACTLLGL